MSAPANNAAAAGGKKELTLTHELYQWVIADVIQKTKPEFIQEGADE
jgi:hypothetical protein